MIWKFSHGWSCFLAFLLLATLLVATTGSNASAAEPAPKLCSAISVALSNLLTIQATKTADQIEQALTDMGMTEEGRTRLAAEALKPETLKQIRAKYDPELRAKLKLILMLAGCS